MKDHIEKIKVIIIENTEENNVNTEEIKENIVIEKTKWVLLKMVKRKKAFGKPNHNSLRKKRKKSRC